ncbi:MAG: glycosyltransferase [Actinomycetota bacterium]|nr:glycosyltransferase [Actinomycetota bacterium]
MRRGRRRRSPRAPDRRGPLLNLPRRARLTLAYYGWGETLKRALTFPLRFTPLRHRVGYGVRFGPERAFARAWYRREARPVTVVIPTYGDPAEAIAAVRSVRATTDPALVRVVVVDDASPPEHRVALRDLDGADVILGDENLGFAGNVNRGLRASHGDVVVLNSDVIAHDGWLECLQYAAYDAAKNGVIGPKLLYPDGRIQSAGSYRPAGAPEWFDHRFRFRSADHEPANAVFPALAITGACIYLRREVIERVGLMDERFGMAFEDVDYCLRAWEAGFRVLYCPWAELTHAESVTRGTEVGEREAESQRRFWAKWGDWFDRREVRTPDGRLRVIYVTEDTGVGGGHRDVFEHLNRLRARGHEAELYSLGGPPDWFDLDVPVHTFADYDALTAALRERDALKVATWWNTAVPVWVASVSRGIPVYFVQDIETSYYPDDPAVQSAVLASYREEFHFMTISGWNRDRLREHGQDAALIPPGIDLDTFRPLGEPRRDNLVLAIGRSNPLKNIGLTVDAFRALAPGRAELRMFGIEPELGEEYGVPYVDSPGDEEVNQLFNQAAVFVQTSIHEGFCLPALEVMATGGAVVCTDAHGNRDFCRDQVNCLMPAPDRDGVAAAIQRLLDDPDLRGRLGEAGVRTAREYAWERRIDALETFLESVADGSRASTPVAG